MINAPEALLIMAEHPPVIAFRKVDLVKMRNRKEVKTKRDSSPILNCFVPAIQRLFSQSTIKFYGLTAR